MPLHLAVGSPTTVITDAELRAHLVSVLKSLGERKKVAIVPPDFTRFHSRAGLLTNAVYHYYNEAVTDIMPALGTHAPMADWQIEKMFGVWSPGRG